MRSRFYLLFCCCSRKIKLFWELRLTKRKVLLYFYLMRFKKQTLPEAAVLSLKKILKQIKTSLTNKKRVLNCISRFRLILVSEVENGALRKIWKIFKNRFDKWKFSAIFHLMPLKPVIGSESGVKKVWKIFKKWFDKRKNDAKLWLRCASQWSVTSDK